MQRLRSSDFRSQKAADQRLLSTVSNRFQVIVILVLLTTTGCAKYLANIINVFNGPPVPAEFKGLDGKRVAVLCTTETGTCSDEVSIRLASSLRGLLAKNLNKATLITQEEVDRWLTSKIADDRDLIEVGRGVKADYVINVELLNLKLKDGPTLYRGRSDVTLTLCDTKTGKTVFRKVLPEYTYPVIAGQSTTETDEDRFRRAYLFILADKLARCFYAHEVGQDIAVDATIHNLYDAIGSYLKANRGYYTS